MADNRTVGHNQNPGSISYPRGKYTAIGGTFAIVETFADENAKQIEAVTGNSESPQCNIRSTLPA